MVKIEQFTFLGEATHNGKAGVLVYLVNEWGKAPQGAKKFASLYISASDGTQFARLNPNAQALLSWQYIASKNRLKFTTIGGHGGASKAQRWHYYVDLDAPYWPVRRYFPLGG